jgi:GT2 family glycosyltransferase
MDIKTLIAVPSPRDIVIFKNALDKIEGVDKLIVKYHPENEAYNTIETYFLEHKDKYNFLCLIPDDLIVRNKDFQALIQTIEDYGGPEKIPVLSGVCNLDNVPGKSSILCICQDSVIHPQRRRRNWQWMDMRSADWLEFKKERLREVKFSGFACQFIRRDIVEKIGLHGDLHYNELHRQAQDYSFDVIFCWLCLQAGIPIYVNPQVQMLHLRGSDHREVKGIQPLLVRKREKKVIYVDAEGKEEDITPVLLTHKT